MVLTGAFLMGVSVHTRESQIRLGLSSPGNPFLVHYLIEAFLTNFL
jgi:hypothetical protein